MRISVRHNPGFDPSTVNPTPTEIALRPALRGGVSPAGGVYDPAPLTCTVYDPMVQPEN